MTKHDTLWEIVKVLAVVGIILASYLLYNYLSTNPLTLCTISDKINCDAVTKGTLATIFGIPVSLVGLVGYITILFSAIKKKKKLLLGMTTFGMVFCLRLTILELFVVKVICPVCVMCQLIMLTEFSLAIYLLKTKESTNAIAK